MFQLCEMQTYEKFRNVEIMSKYSETLPFDFFPVTSVSSQMAASVSKLQANYTLTFNV